MKKYFVVFIIFSSINICYPQKDSSKYFPLEIGNRWDYHIDVHIHGGHYYTDYFSVTIKDTETINGKKYFVFSSNLPFIYPFSKYYRMEDNKVYLFNEQDSTDCFSFRFDVPVDSLYINCRGDEIFIAFIDTIPSWDGMDIQQAQNNYIFSEHYGIYQGYAGAIVEQTYRLYGCIISGVTYGNLFVSTGEVKKLPIQFKLEQNYPNPFNPTTVISYSIPERSIVSLKLYNILGKEVKALVSEEKSPGEYKYIFNGSNYPSGIYFYRLQTDKFSSTKKLLIIK